MERFKLIVSAIAGYLVEVAPIEEGGRPWTDGVTVFAPADALFEMIDAYLADASK